jgi:hypothetical protein
MVSDNLALAGASRPKENELRHQWGLLLFSVFSLLSLARLELQKIPGHYRVFTGAGRAIWHGGDPYGDTFGTGVGYFFYSPACALTFFGPISALPEKLGIVVYMGLSWAVFVAGARRFWKAYGGDSRGLQWFWALITAQMVGGILASKLEIVIAGLLLGCIAELARPAPRRLVVALVLGAILNWKFQPLPVVGLLLLSWIWIRRDWRLPAALGAALAFWYAMPFAIFGPAYILAIQRTWQTTFSGFVTTSVLNFENVFAFLHGAFGVDLSFAWTQVASAGIGALMAALVALAIARSPEPDRWRRAALLSTALGTAFMTALSPLGQNNALILYAPLLACALLCRRDSARPRAWTALLAASCAGMILAYSDVMPAGAREALRHLSIKPVFCLALAAGVALELWPSATRPPSLAGFASD